MAYLNPRTVAVMRAFLPSILRNPRRRFWCLSSLLLAGMLYHLSLAHYIYLPLPFNHSPDTDIWPVRAPAQAHLSELRAVSATALPSVDQNLSGLAYQPETQTLLAVQNRPTTLLRLLPSGRVLSTHALDGISDTEGIAYLGHGQIALVSEKHNQIVLARLPGGDEPISLHRAPTLQLPTGMFQNAGLEGITYVPQLDALFVVSEHSPRSIFRVDGICPQANACSFERARITDLSHWLEEAEFAKDLASVEYDPQRRSLVFLSEASGLLFELDLQGRPLGVRTFGEYADDPDMPQPEGLAFGPGRTLYVVSEPNLLFTFKPR